MQKARCVVMREDEVVEMAYRTMRVALANDKVLGEVHIEMNESREKEPIGTPYDDVYRTLLSDCPRLLIPMINEIFDEHFTKEDEIVFSKDIYKFNGRAEGSPGKIGDISRING